MNFLNRLLTWLDEHTPVFCVKCGRLVFSKDSRRRRMTNGAVVTLCLPCDRELFWDE